MRVLLVEDDAQLGEHLTTVLKSYGFGVNAVSDSTELESILSSNDQYSVIVLDRLLGAVDTKDFLPRLKTRWPQVPVVVLSAISTPSERTDLLNLGADDYIGKPFSTQELLARIKVVQRRAGHVPLNYIHLGNTVLDFLKRVITVEGNSVPLPPKEFLLMRVLSEEPGRVWSRTELLDCVWGMSSSVETNVVEATVTNLRRRLEDLGSILEIKNMRNAGYWLEA